MCFLTWSINNINIKAGETPAMSSVKEMKKYWGEVNEFTKHCEDR
jgi:hypothetical protein